MEEMLETLKRSHAELEVLRVAHRDALGEYLTAKYEMPISLTLYHSANVEYKGQPYSFYSWTSDNELKSMCSIDSEALSDEELLADIREKTARVTLFIEIRNVLKELL